MRSYAHIINPYSNPGNGEWQLAQQVTFATLLRAQKEAEGRVEVRLFTTQFKEDRTIVPGGFTLLRDLDRSVTDIAAFRRERRLPLLGDILSRLYESTDAEYLVYTNADIALMPSFYLAVDAMIAKGYDAIVINRRCISSRYSSPEQLPEMYAEAGTMHTGYDTFVLHRSLFEKIDLGHLCIGIPFNDTALIHHLYAFAKNFRLCTEKHLTFHLGQELIKDWGDPDYYAHNRREFMRVLSRLKPHFDIAAFPGANLPFFVRHFKWLMNPTFHYPTMLRLDISQLGKKRRPRQPKEIPGGRQAWASWMIARVNFRDRDLE
jgi:hypothetical protein